MTRRSSDAPAALPTEVMQILWPSLQVGAFSGFSGLLFGSFAGIARSNHPALFAVGSGVQWFTLGSTFWATRATVLHIWGEDQVKPRDKISASAIAGCVGGSFGGMLRGKGNIIPGAVMFTLFGAGGQKIYNMVDDRHSEEVETPEIQKSRSWMDSKWSPVKVLTDEEYERILQEKLLQVNAEIAIIDENIQDLRSQKEMERKASKEADKEADEKPSP